MSDDLSQLLSILLEEPVPHCRSSLTVDKLGERDLTPPPPLVPGEAGQPTLQDEGLAPPQVVARVVGEADIQSQGGGQDRQEEEERRHDVSSSPGRRLKHSQHATAQIYCNC